LIFVISNQQNIEHSIFKVIKFSHNQILTKIFVCSQEATTGHHTELSGYPEVKPSVASLQATVMSNAAAAAAAYQTQLMARGASAAGAAAGAEGAAGAGLLGAAHHGDVTLLQDYHTL